MSLQVVNLLTISDRICIKLTDELQLFLHNKPNNLVFHTLPTFTVILSLKA